MKIVYAIIFFYLKTCQWIQLIQSKFSGIGLRSRFVEQNDEKYQTDKTIPLYEVAKIADRYKVSNRIAAAIASAALVDYKVTRPNETRSVID